MNNETEDEVSQRICDPALRELVNQLSVERDESRKEELHRSIIEIVQTRERDNFLTRFILRDFTTWHELLTKEETDVSCSHKAEFFEPYLVDVLCENDGEMEPIEAIEKILDRVKGKLTLADFTLTASKRFRYDTTIRFLANSMKVRGLLSRDEVYKNKTWALVEREKAKCKSYKVARNP